MALTWRFLILALVALTASFSFADGHVAMYMGVAVHTDGGRWDDVDGRLAQTDASAWLAGATVPMGIQGKTEYSFDIAYIGGLEDNAIGFGAIVPGFVMGLAWDPANLDGSGLHAQVYNAAGEIHEHAGIKYNFEIPAAMIAGITAKMVMNTPLTVRIRIDSSNGNVWVKDPFDATTWWAFTLGQSLDGEDHSMIGVGTTSMAASFSNFSANRYDRFFFEPRPSIAVGGGGPGGTGSTVLIGRDGFPAPTSKADIFLDVTEQEPSERLTLGDVDRKITEVLKAHGYRYRYFPVQNGFAIATFDRYSCDTGDTVGRGVSFGKMSSAARALIKLLEKTPNATLIDILELFDISEDIVPITSIAQFMLKGLVPRLLSIELPDGCYRSMVFVLNKGAVKIADRKMDYATVKNLLRFGAKELDQELRDMKYTGEHKTTVLIYQYHRSDTNISFVEPDDGRRIEAGEHLFRAGLGTLMGPKTRSDDDHRR